MFFWLKVRASSVLPRSVPPCLFKGHLSTKSNGKWGTWNGERLFGKDWLFICKLWHDETLFNQYLNFILLIIYFRNSWGLLRSPSFQTSTERWKWAWLPPSPCCSSSPALLLAGRLLALSSACLGGGCFAGCYRHKHWKGKAVQRSALCIRNKHGLPHSSGFLGPVKGQYFKAFKFLM